jgi:hypothetical protein
MKLEDLKRGAQVKGLDPLQLVTVVDVQWYGSNAVDKPLISVLGKPLVTFVCPGHPLLDATLDLVLERHRDILKRGAVLVDTTDPGTEVRALFYLQQSIHDARPTRSGERSLISQEVQFVEIDGRGNVRNAGSAPYARRSPVARLQ